MCFCCEHTPGNTLRILSCKPPGPESGQTGSVLLGWDDEIQDVSFWPPSSPSTPTPQSPPPRAPTGRGRTDLTLQQCRKVEELPEGTRGPREALLPANFPSLHILPKPKLHLHLVPSASQLPLSRLCLCRRNSLTCKVCPDSGEGNVTVSVWKQSLWRTLTV